MIIYEIDINALRENMEFLISDNLLWSKYVLTFHDQSLESFPNNLFIGMECHKHLISWYGYFGIIHLAC